jgi:catalase
MAMHNPKGRANYEPNSWGPEIGGPRESPERGFVSFPEEIAGAKQRVRSETFADHYSQARQFYISQTPNEQRHIQNALVFELSKCERPDIRGRMVGHLRNIDAGLASAVRDGLRLKEMPEAAEAARPTRQDLEPSPALSIVLNGPDSFKGRKLGVLVTDGTDRALFDALKAALDKEGALLEVIAPQVGGVEASDGSWIDAKQKIDGGPSVLYDAVAVLASEAGVATLLAMPPARDFLADAFAHCKFIGYSAASEPLFAKAGVDAPDEGCIELTNGKAAPNFIKACRKLRHWPREDALG